MALLQKIKNSIINTGSFNLTPNQKKQIKSAIQNQDKDKIIKTVDTLANTLLNENYYGLASIRNSAEILLDIGAAYIGTAICYYIKKIKTIKSNMHIKKNFEYYISSTNNMNALIFYLLCYAEFKYDKQNLFYKQLMFLGKIDELRPYINNIFSKIPDKFIVNEYILNLEREFQIDDDKVALKNILLALYQKNKEIEYEFKENILSCDLKMEVRMKTGFVNHHIILTEMKEDLFQILKNLFITLINNNIDNIDVFDEFFLKNEIIRPDNYAHRLIKELDDDSNIKPTDICRGVNEIYLHCKCLYTLKFVYSAVSYTIHLNEFEKIYEEGKKLAFCAELTEYLAPILASSEDGRRILYKIILNTHDYSRISAVKYFIPKSTSDLGLLTCSSWKNDLEIKSTAFYAFVNSNLHEAFLNDTIYIDPMYSRIFPGELIHIFNAMVHDHDFEYSIKDIKKFWVVLEKYFIYEKNVNYYVHGKEFLNNLYNYLLDFDSDDIANIKGYSLKIHMNLITLVKKEMKK